MKMFYLKYHFNGLFRFSLIWELVALNLICPLFSWDFYEKYFKNAYLHRCETCSVGQFPFLPRWRIRIGCIPFAQNWAWFFLNKWHKFPLVRIYGSFYMFFSSFCKYFSFSLQDQLNQMPRSFSDFFFNSKGRHLLLLTSA